MYIQMPLKIGLRDEASFATFVTQQEALAMALNSMQGALQQEGGDAFYLYGDSGVGKTHLLQAACRYVTEKEQASVYLPMNDTSLPLVADVLVGLEQTELVCLDEVEAYMGDPAWEKALANLITKSSVQGNIVIMSGKQSMHSWPLITNELTQALVKVLPIKVEALTDKEDIISALQRHSQTLGFELPQEVGNYLIKQYSYDLQELLAVLKLLEQATLVEKRRLTLPFVKQTLNKE